MISAGDKVKHYEILEQIGKGGMGEVYLAQDTVLDRKVAIKFLPEEMQIDAKARVRLVREAKAAASLDHPFICKIYETGEFEGKAFIVMEYIEGKDLRGKLDEGVLPLRDSLEMVLEIAEALEEAHEKGIVHRDLKPSNVMITPRGHVKVMDFGLAKHFLTEGEGDITQTLTQDSITGQGAIVGTLAYMSPEQARGEKVDARSDIFSLGILIYEMTTGRHPFSRANPLETLTSILRDATPAVNITPKMMNPILTPILRKALAKEPESRYQNTKDLIDDIKKLLREATGGARFIFRPVRLPAYSPVKVTVLLADIENKTGDPVFDGVLEKLLGISLDGSYSISVYDSDQASQHALHIKPASEGRLDIELAQLISRREGINAVVSASIESIKRGYLIKAWALDPISSEKLTEVEQSIEEKADVLKVADYISAKLEAGLGVIPPDSKEALIRETFTTTSLEAMKAFSNAQELDAQGKQEEAMEEYLRALDNDPNFGRAYIGLANIYYNRGQPQEAEHYYQESLKRIDQMNEREKLRTRGAYYLFKLNSKGAIEEYSTLVEKYPGDAVGHSMLAFAYFLDHNMKRAYEEGSHALELSQYHIVTRYNLSWFALAAGELERARQEAHTLVQQNPSFEEAYVVRALSELAQGQSVQAAETYRQLESISPLGASLTSTGLADLAFYEGRLVDAIDILKKGIAFDIEKNFSSSAAYKYNMLAHVYILQDRKDLALNAAENAVSLSKWGEVLFEAAQVYLSIGQDDKARSLAGELSKKIEPKNQAYAKLIGGEMSMARGNTAGAISLFREAQDIVDTWLGHFALGRAYLEAEAYTEAYSEFEKCLQRSGETTSIFLNDLPSYHYLPQIYYYIGRAQEGLGSDAAADSYNTFLKIKEKADDEPFVEDARRRLNKL